MLFTAETDPKTFAYVGENYAITAAEAGTHAFILKFVNLSDFVIVVQPNEFIYKAASGRFYIGQVFEHEVKDSHGDVQKYSASFLLKGHSFAGLKILGAFQEQDQIEELSVRIGAIRFYLQPMEKAAFGALSAKLRVVDPGNPNTEAELANLGIAAAGTRAHSGRMSCWNPLP